MNVLTWFYIGSMLVFTIPKSGLPFSQYWLAFYLQIGRPYFPMVLVDMSVEHECAKSKNNRGGDGGISIGQDWGSATPLKNKVITETGYRTTETACRGGSRYVLMGCHNVSWIFKTN